jgi:hypothetical protein
MPDGGGKPIKAKRAKGRPSTYVEEIGNEICARLAEGESLAAICTDPHLPQQSTIKMWVHDPPKAALAHSFPDRYARARSMGYEVLADQILTIGDAPIYHNGEPDNALVQHARLMSENRKWLLSKLLPKQFGDKVTQEITGEDGGALITRIELVPIAPRYRQIEHDEEAGGKPEPARGKDNG